MKAKINLLKNKKIISQESKHLQGSIVIIVCVLIILFFSLVARVAIGYASGRINEEIEAHYQMLANKTTEQASAWIVKETQILLNQKASLEIINDFNPDFLNEYFTYIVNDYNYDNYVYDIYFVSTDNIMSDGSGYVPDPDIDFRQRDWYVGALSSDNMCYTIPYIDVDTGQFVVTVSIKVFDRNRKFMGVLALDIFVDKLFSITEQQDLPDDSYLFIISNEMGIVTHPYSGYGYISDEPQNLRDISDKDYTELADFILEEKWDGSYCNIEDYDGKNRCFFASKVDDCEWYVVAAISKDVIDESRVSLSHGILLSLLICLTIGIILTLWGTNFIIKKLTEAQERANEASKAKSRFLANMSHEIRTPINAVLGMDEILLRECEDEKLKEYALNIQSAGQSLLGLVNDILDFSKIESDKLDIVEVNYELGELINSCNTLIKLRAESKSLSYSVERSEYLPKTLYGDEIRIRQIISNLLTNAVKYTKAGSVVMSVDWIFASEGTGSLKVSVKDTGIGIKTESMNELFSSFQRIDMEKNRNIEGTGLGLSITKRLAELMGGNIEVSSEYGKGSVFTVTIPQKIVDKTNIKSFGALEDEKKTKQTRELKTQNARILVVDDVAMNIKVVTGLLKRTGITIDTANSGPEAIEFVKNNKYDVIFLDHMMPEMDGIQTLNILKNEYSSELGSTPVVMLTANAILGVEEEYYKEGFASYLCKPVSRDKLCDCLMEFLPKDKIIN